MAWSKNLGLEVRRSIAPNGETVWARLVATHSTFGYSAPVVAEVYCDKDTPHEEVVRRLLKKAVS